MTLDFNFNLSSYLCFPENSFYNFSQFVRAMLAIHTLNSKNYIPIKIRFIKFMKIITWDELELGSFMEEAA